MIREEKQSREGREHTGMGDTGRRHLRRECSPLGPLYLHYLRCSFPQEFHTDSPPTPPPWRWLKMDIEFYPVVQECKKKTIFKYHHQEICQFFFFFFPKVKICFHEESGRASATALMTGMIEDFAGGSAIRTCLPMQETQV